MARQTRTLNLRDFTGGLNLTSNLLQVSPNEMSACLNVDPLPRGGFRTRRGSSTLFQFDPLVEYDPGDGLALGFGGLKAFTQSDGTQWLTWTWEGSWVQAEVDGSNFGGAIDTATSPFSTAIMNDKAWAVHPSATACYAFDGSTVATLTHSWSPDYDAPTSDNMPLARVICAHKGYMFVANTIESSTVYSNRLRWSHPGKADAWREEDYWSIGEDDEGITALCSFGGDLIVFKEHSVWLFRGDSTETWADELLTDQAGCIGWDATVASNSNCYFWAPGYGVHAYNGKTVYWIGQRLHEALLDGRIEESHVSLGFARGRLYAGIGWGDEEENATYGDRRCLVWDENVGGGCWTLHSHNFYGMAWLQNTDQVLAVTLAQTVSISIETGDYQLDPGTYAPEIRQIEMDNKLGDVIGPIEWQIGGYARTSWLDLGQSAVRKRWRRPRFVMRHLYPTAVTYTVYKDYNVRQERRQAQFVLPTDPSEGLWDALVWDVGVWGGSAQSSDRSRIVTSSGLGSCVAVMVRLDGPAHATEDAVSWGVDGLVFPYELRRVR